MNKIVENSKELRIFNELVKGTWVDEGFDVEEATNESECVLFYDKEGYYGTVEFKNPKKSDIYSSFHFDKVSEVTGKIIEIDKVSTLPNRRGLKGLKEILSYIGSKIEEDNIDYYIALIAPKFYFTLKRVYRFPIYRCGKRFEYKGDTVFPVYIDCKEAFKKEKKRNVAI